MLISLRLNIFGSWNSKLFSESSLRINYKKKCRWTLGRSGGRRLDSGWTDEHRLAVGRCRFTTFEGSFLLSLSLLCLPAVTLHLLGRALREWMGKNKENFLFYRLPPEGDFLEWRERRRRSWRRWKMHTQLVLPTNQRLYTPPQPTRDPTHLAI